ncbi:sterile alpha motif domain-containing protein 9-like [Xiphophorus couchianus]|uniref:sterile alpha motif domain-containing protein 9-like n=1 Tax=Xiphophorus couchianus TaxID=32473 RepID=UPI001016BC9A|nr:sterile alpha motif domain-containing protein 9-like [Xiphophorus couchianus]
MAENVETKEDDLPPDINDWDKSQVKVWALKLKGLDDSTADLLFEEKISGPSLLLLDKSDLTKMGVKFGPATLIIHARDELIKLKRENPTSSSDKTGKPSKPYPFGRYHDAYRYIKDSILSVPESGTLDLIEPCHEFKAFINTSDENQLEKFTTEVIRFAAACTNSRTNGTIHFGIGDKPDFVHGQVLGVTVNDKERYANELKSAINSHFGHKNAAQMCIKPPRFVEVLNRNTASSDKFVIEVDIEPRSAICGENIFHTYNTKKGKKKIKETESQPVKSVYIRDGGSSRDLLASSTSSKTRSEFNQFEGKMSQLSKHRKEAEEKHLKRIKTTTQGSSLINMITGGAFSMDKSNFEHYVIVTNKSHPSRREVLNKRFLVIFLLLSTVSEVMDPLVETFSMFLQELGGSGQILCICDDESTFISWRDLIQAKCGVDISDRCISDLSFAEVNGTVLSLWSENRRAKRFLPCGGESKVGLERKFEQTLNTLEILCVNQCEGGNEDRVAIEENFYRGGKVSWWNFHFSELPGLTPFIKRDQFDYIMNTVIPDLCSLPKACVLFNLLHLPSCGGTTLARHVLWALRDKYRCAVLREKSDFVNVADQVIKLLMYQYDEQTPRVPVLLMIDDFDDMEKVEELQFAIETQFIEKDLQAAKVILLNCMRSEFNTVTGLPPDTVFIGNNLSDKELKLFEVKFKEIEQQHWNVKTFYGFMIMKENFNEEYIKGVVKNTLKNFNMDQKNAQLFAVLVLLRVYCKYSTFSWCLCLDVLDQPIPVCGGLKIHDVFGEFSSFISFCWDQDKIKYVAISVTYSIIARQCLEELKTTHKVTKAKITNFLLATDQLYECTQGTDNLFQCVHDILVKRFSSSEEVSQFSPLIQQIAEETPGQEEIVLSKAAKRLEDDAVVFQLLARYYYLKKKNFIVAKDWAKKAMGLSKDNSYIADTSAQVLKHELKNEISNCQEGEFISPEKLRIALKMAQSAMEAFQKTQTLAKKESLNRYKIKTNNCSFNTSGFLGEIQVGVLVLGLLEKTPVFSLDDVRHDIMSEFLSGNIPIERIKRMENGENGDYYHILQQFEKMLYNLKKRMKFNFDHLDRMQVNLGTITGVKNNREQVARKEISECFERYTQAFCETKSERFLKKKNFNLELHQARQFLEKEKADTYSGILDCLTKDISTEKIKEIAGRYNFICQSKHNPKTIEIINMIYANIVLGCVTPESAVVSYQDLLRVLSVLLKETHQDEEYFSLLFIAVVLLWPSPEHELFMYVGTYISQLKTSYFDQMKEVFNGKRPIVHFLLGKGSNYERLLQMKVIQSCITRTQQFASQWGNGQIWENEKVRGLLKRVEGRVDHNVILVDYSNNVRLEVIPLFRSQISGLHGRKVSFFIGFSIKGPLALGIERIEEPR